MYQYYPDIYLLQKSIQDLNGILEEVGVEVSKWVSLSLRTILNANNTIQDDLYFDLYDLRYCALQKNGVAG